MRIRETIEDLGTKEEDLLREVQKEGHQGRVETDKKENKWRRE